jgi:pimeloyl-ACP methyl ester carboxylesterase
VHFSVFATEDVPFIDPASIPALTEGTFLGTYLIDQYTAACKAWGGRGALPAGFHDSVRSDVPVLLLSGYYDPSTPPQMAAKVARHLPNSRHVIVRNEAHGAGFDCARQLVVDFLTRGTLEGLGPACEDVGPIVFDVLEEDQE